MIREVSPSDGSVGVSTAYFEPAERTLHIGIRQIGSRDTLKEASVQTATVTLERITGRPQVEVEGIALPEEEYRHAPDGALTFAMRAAPEGETRCALRLS